MLKTFWIALVFVAAGGMTAARAQSDDATTAGPNVEQRAPCYRNHRLSRTSEG